MDSTTFADLALLADWKGMIFGTVIFLTSLFLILLVLIQRGRGGGLAGALGGAGGQSAFGAKAGDTFTKVTMFVATFWILLSMACIKFVNSSVVPKATTQEPGLHSTDSPGTGSDEDEKTDEDNKTGADDETKTGVDDDESNKTGEDADSDDDM